MVWASSVVLLLEAALTLVVTVVYNQTRESPNVGGNYALGLLAAPCAAVAGAVLAAAVSGAIVLPVVRVSGALGRKFSGRERWWWAPLVMAAVLAVLWLAAAVGGAVPWSLCAVLWGVVTSAALALPAWATGSRCVRRTGAVAGWGALFVIGVGVLGCVALRLNLLQTYRPPTLSPAALVGTWSDNEGATLRFAADGKVTATGVKEHREENFNTTVKPCTGKGTWTFDEGENSWTQEVHVTLPDCSWPAWNIGGTQEQPTLYQYIGDPDSWDLYTLKKR
ncbi:hypothetical protein GCM10010394_49120 [Streptomyces crystallinus]|uniref:Sulfite exporter TauE/SafE family protein n=2 Tax=Streptomyces crystallinus TaxID=68191 RepID=A0ABN1GKF7_9ACTN